MGAARPYTQNSVEPFFFFFFGGGSVSGWKITATCSRGPLTAAPQAKIDSSIRGRGVRKEGGEETAGGGDIAALVFLPLSKREAHQKRKKDVAGGGSYMPPSLPDETSRHMAA